MPDLIPSWFMMGSIRWRMPSMQSNQHRVCIATLRIRPRHLAYFVIDILRLCRIPRSSDHENPYKRRGESPLQVLPLQAHHRSKIDANYDSETLKGGALGGAAGLALGVGGVFAAGARFPAFRQLTLPLRAFLITSSSTFGGMWTPFSPPTLHLE